MNYRTMKPIPFVGRLVVALASLAAFSAVAAAPDADAKAILQQSGVKGGIVIQLGIGDGKLTSALRGNDSYQVQGLDTDAKKVAAAREAIYAAGKGGPVAVEKFDGKVLPYIDNFANLVVAEDLGGVPMAEVNRVLVPNGVAMVKKASQWVKSIRVCSDRRKSWR